MSWYCVKYVIYESDDIANRIGWQLKLPIMSNLHSQYSSVIIWFSFRLEHFGIVNGVVWCGEEQVRIRMIFFLHRALPSTLQCTSSIVSMCKSFPIIQVHLKNRIKMGLDLSSGSDLQWPE